METATGPITILTDKNMKSQAAERAQWVKVPAAELDDLSSFTRTHTCKERTDSQSCSLTSTNMPWHVSHPQIYKSINVKKYFEGETSFWSDFSLFPFPPSQETSLIGPKLSSFARTHGIVATVAKQQRRRYVCVERGVPMPWPLRCKELTGDISSHLPSRGSWLPRGSWLSWKPGRYLKGELIHFVIIFYTSCEWFKFKLKILTLFQKLNTRKQKHPSSS